MSKTVKLKCEHCGVGFEKKKGEYKRSEKLGRKHYCSLSCATKANMKQRKDKGEVFSLPNEFIGVSGERQCLRDEYSDFKPLRKLAWQRRFKHEVTIDVKYLKELWELQKGRCVYTGIEMKLPKWNKNKEWNTASIDRIDSSKGYIEGNIQLITCMANFAKNDFDHETMLLFCEQIAKKHQKIV